MSKALKSALRVVARMKGDGDVTVADLKKVLDAALGRLRNVAGGDDADDRDERHH